MKHFLKIFIPALLILAILVAAGWFFFAHRTDLTMSVFAYWGDHYYEVGRYDPAGRDIYSERKLFEGRIYACQRHYAES